MTISIHTKHYYQTGMDISSYLLILLYENGNPPTKEIEKFLGVSERTVIRMRQTLEAQGYLKKIDTFTWELTDKLYAN